MVFDSMLTIALLGTGLLGEAIGRRLLEQGVTLKVWNRTAAKCQPLVEQGAVLIKNLAGAAKGCHAVITVLRDGPVTQARRLLDHHHRRLLLPLAQAPSWSCSCAQRPGCRGDRLAAHQEPST